MMMGIIRHQSNLNRNKLVDVEQAVSDPMKGIKLFDIRDLDQDKFVHSLLQRKARDRLPESHFVEYEIFKNQSTYNFGYIPLSQQVMPKDSEVRTNDNFSAIDLHRHVKAVGGPSFFGAGIPIDSQLNVHRWAEELHNYWDQQLIQFA